MARLLVGAVPVVALPDDALHLSRVVRTGQQIKVSLPDGAFREERLARPVHQPTPGLQMIQPTGQCFSIRCVMKIQD